MTTLIEQIKADQVKARKARLTATATLLTTLLGEASIIGKNAGRETTDDEVVAVVNKFIKNIDECLAVEKNPMKIITLTLEKAELDTYRPKQITAEQMFSIIQKVRAIKGAKLEMKDIMQNFKKDMPGMYDGKVLSEVAKNYLAAQV